MSLSSLELFPPKILKLKRQYLQLVEPEQLDLPAPKTLRLQNVQQGIYNSLFRPSNVPYPPPDRYKFRVLKMLMGKLEQAIVDPEEDVGFPYS